MTDVPLLVGTGRCSVAKGPLRACELRPGSSRLQVIVILVALEGLCNKLSQPTFAKKPIERCLPKCTTMIVLRIVRARIVSN